MKIFIKKGELDSLTNLTQSLLFIAKTEGAIKNGQSRETGNIEYTRHKTTTKKSTKQNTEKDNQHGPHQKSVVNSDAREG